MQLRQLAPIPLLLALACGDTPLPRTDPVGRPFPTAEGESLAGDVVRLPADFRGAPVVLLLGYVQRAQFDADRWLLGLAQADLGVRFVEVPTIKGFVPGLVRGTIDNGMRGGIPAEDWASVVTVYGDRASEIVRLTGNEAPQNVRVVLLDAAGTVRWFHDEGYSAGSLIELGRALRALDGGSRAQGARPAIRASTIRHYAIDSLDAEPSGAPQRVVVETFGRDGRKLRTEARDASGSTLSTFSLVYGETDRAIGMVAFYAEDGMEPSLEIFEHSADGRRRSITYLDADGRVSGRAEYDLDERGASLERRYMRADSTVYGVDTESYDERGDSRGWTFTRLDRDQRVVNEYRYRAYDQLGRWTRRVLVRDGRPLELQVRALEDLDG